MPSHINLLPLSFELRKSLFVGLHLRLRSAWCLLCLSVEVRGPWGTHLNIRALNILGLMNSYFQSTYNSTSIYQVLETSSYFWVDRIWVLKRQRTAFVIRFKPGLAHPDVYWSDTL